jgi:hypothetical protein
MNQDNHHRKKLNHISDMASVLKQSRYPTNILAIAYANRLQAKGKERK